MSFFYQFLDPTATDPYVPGSFLQKTKQKPATPATASLLASFDKSILQVTDWLLAEKEMLRKQIVTVGDIDGILKAIDKQKVSNRCFNNNIKNHCYTFPLSSKNKPPVACTCIPFIRISKQLQGHEPISFDRCMNGRGK